MNVEQIINISIEEYSSLREEVVNSVDRQYQMANWAISALAVLVAAVIAGWETLLKYPYCLTALLLILLPGIMTSYLVSWTHVISKIAQLGKRLFDIEENVARAIDKASLRNAFNLESAESVNPYHYLLGWEHRLWRDGENFRIRSTIRIVKVFMAGLYVTSIAAGVLAIALLQNLNSLVIIAIAGVSLLIWSTVWWAFARYLEDLHADGKR